MYFLSVLYGIPTRFENAEKGNCYPFELIVLTPPPYQL